MELTYDIIITEDRIPEMMGRVPEIVDMGVRKFAFMIESEAKNMVRVVGAIDTGAMMNSIHTRTSRFDGWITAEGAAAIRRPGIEGGPVPAPSKLGHAFVGVGVDYGIYVELGTYKMGARPFFTPAVERMQPEFSKFIKEEFDKLK